MVENTYNVNKGQIINASRIVEGGKVLVVPFVAGPRVYATDATQRVSLFIVKSLTETLESTASAFEFLGGDRAHEAELIIRGRIVGVTPRKKFWQIFPSRKKFLSVEGKLQDRKNSRDLLLFSHKIESDEAGMTLNDLGSKMGVEIAKFILKAINQTP